MTRPGFAASTGCTRPPTAIARPSTIIPTPTTNTRRNLSLGPAGALWSRHQTKGGRSPLQKERIRMGFFKDLRDLNKTGKEMTKERGGSFKMMKDGVAQANEMLQQEQTDQATAEKLANEGVDGTAT